MMGVPIKKMYVTDEEARNIIRASLGNKLVGDITPHLDIKYNSPILTKFDFIWKFIGDKDE